MKRYWSLGLFLCVGFMSSSLFALNTQTLRPLGDHYEGFHNPGTSGLAPGSVQIGAVFDYTDQPIQINFNADARSLADNVDSFLTAHSYFNIGISDFLSVGASLPINLSTDVTPVSNANLTLTDDDLSLGDLYLQATLKLIDHQQKSGFGLGLVPFFTLPLNDQTTGYFNNKNITAGARIVADYWVNGKTYLSANMGGRYRADEEEFFGSGVDIGHETLFGASFVQHFTEKKMTDVFVELIGASPFSDLFNFSDFSPLEVVGGLRQRLIKNTITLVVGGAKGLNDSYGSPNFRLFSGLTLTTQPRLDSAPKSVKPLPIPTATPRPQPKKKIGQLVLHLRDEKNQALNANIVVKNLSGQTQGRINGQVWKKILPAGEYQVSAEAEGYTKAKKVVLLRPGKRLTDKIVLQKIIQKGEKIEVLGKILFPSGKSSIRKESYTIVDRVADILKRHPEVKQVRIEAHTDSVGSARLNLGLSKKRAASVLQALVERGVQPSRLTSVGLGEAQPIASNDTREGRSLNRRVEFTILESDGNAVKVKR